MPIPGSNAEPAENSGTGGIAISILSSPKLRWPVSRRKRYHSSRGNGDIFEFDASGHQKKIQFFPRLVKRRSSTPKSQLTLPVAQILHLAAEKSPGVGPVAISRGARNAQCLGCLLMRQTDKIS